ncbi:MAG: hypothetical protein EA352_05125 [Gemmatimonadales bacterium]|nr:MAG: hypothetical protein EA352_05125 [Gemmatimonadales bacterium]
MTRRLASLPLLLLITMATGCSGGAGDRAGDAEALEKALLGTPGLEAFPGRLVEGARQADDAPPPPRAQVEELGPDRVEALLGRLSSLPAPEDNGIGVELRPASEPPPRTGAVQMGEFPAPEDRGPPAVESPDGPLTVLRASPDGPVPIAGQLSVTFDRPMVAVGSHDDAVLESTPVRLSPQVPGAWRWVGTRTLVFEPEAPRLPMATEFTARIDAGTRAADGTEMAEALEWQFATPPAVFERLHPSGDSNGLEPVMVATFDQRIDAADLLDQLVVEAGGEPVSVRRATDEEIEGEPAAARAVERGDPERILAFVPTDPLPRDSPISVTLPEGSTSAEGPRLTQEPRSHEFRTHGALQVVEQRCGLDPCRPTAPLRLMFSNQLDWEQEVDGLVEVEPEIPDMDVSIRGRSVFIQGRTEGRTKYVLRVSDALVDVFGQTLESTYESEFVTGSMPPRMSFPSGNLVTLDASRTPEFEYFTTNHADARVVIREVSPSDWPEWMDVVRYNMLSRDPVPELPGQVVFDEHVDFEAREDQVERQRVPLHDWLNDAGTGQFLVTVEPDSTLGSVPPPSSHTRGIWVQVSAMGLDAASDHETLLAWVTDLADGSPLDGVELRLGPEGQAVPSDATGLAELPLPSTLPDDVRHAWLEARRGGDVAILPAVESARQPVAWRAEERSDALLWHVFDDRALYRPGETVHLKGWLRQEERRADGGLGLMNGAGHIDYQVSDARGNSLADGSTSLGGLGGFDLSFDLPDTPNLGAATVRLEVRDTDGLTGTSHTHRFQLQEFRTPEFEVQARIHEGPFIGSTRVPAEVEAGYYAGGGLPHAEVNWTVTAEPTHYRPPNRQDWTFGFHSPWWMPRSGGRGGRFSEGFQGSTDSQGLHQLDIELDMEDHARPLALSARARVMDVNRQAWASEASFIAHPAATYVGMKSPRQFVEQGESLEVELVTVDLEGEVSARRPVSVSAARIRWTWGSGGRVEERADEQRCDVTTDDAGLARCEFPAGLGGQYQITAVTTDAEGRRNTSRITRWVGGSSTPAAEQVEMEEALLIPEQEEWGPGDTARVLVQAPFDGAEGLMTLRRHGLAEQHRFIVEGGSTTLEIPIREAWMPGIELNVVLVGAAETDNGAGTRPAIASGKTNLAVSTTERVLDVTLEPRERELSPGAENRIDLRVHDAAGGPVSNAEVALVVVDEAILAMTGYELVDPLGVFYRMPPGGVSDRHLRPSVRLVEPLPEMPVGELSLQEVVVAGRTAEEADIGIPAPPQDLPPPRSAEDAGDETIDAREDFNPLAAFVPALYTDEEGRVSADIQLPDNLTRYRIMAVAVSGATRYGTAETDLTARLPLMVRPSPPRFLNFGDQFELPVVLQNQTGEAMSVEVALDVANLASTGAAGFALEVPANDRVEVRFPLEPEDAGTAHFQVVAASGGSSDAARQSFPVWTPATTEAFATYGTLDEGAVVQPAATPTDVWPQFGQLEITTSSTALQSLTDAFIWLGDYPFTATEAISSRLLAIAALADVLEAFGAEGLPSRDELQATIAADLEQLRGRQNPDGGFGLWARGGESWPFVTLHVAHALVRMEAEGHQVDEELYHETLRHVGEIEDHVPSHYSDLARRHIVAYSLHVRALAGDPDRARARELITEVAELDELTFESTGWLLGLLTGNAGSTSEVERLRRFLANRVTETAGAAHFVRDWQDGDHLILHSSRRADAIVLDALMDDQPDSDLIPALVQGLQAHRSRGRWANTQENAFVLLALKKYFQQYEAQEPDFIARSWLGEDAAGEMRFQGRTTDAHHVDIPMARLAEGNGRHEVVLDKDGPGRLYYRIGLSYAPRSLELEAASHGFEVQRVYRGVDDEDDVRRLDDGWEIRAGARVEVELTLVAPTRRYHVALTDPLPAGLEPMNPALAVSNPPIHEDPLGPDRSSWWGPWYRHQNLRDERAEAFTPLLAGGVYTYTYYARATTPGAFVVPPARAEEMYQPETFGRSASTRVRIVD